MSLKPQICSKLMRDPPSEQGSETQNGAVSSQILYDFQTTNS